MATMSHDNSVLLSAVSSLGVCVLVCGFIESTRTDHNCHPFHLKYLRWIQTAELPMAPAHIYFSINLPHYDCHDTIESATIVNVPMVCVCVCALSDVAIQKTTEFRH